MRYIRHTTPYYNTRYCSMVLCDVYLEVAFMHIYVYMYNHEAEGRLTCDNCNLTLPL